MLSFLRKLIPERSPLRLAYHKWSAIFASLWYRFPGHDLTVIAVTGTSGKSTTVELIWYILNESDIPCGSLSTINFHIKNKTFKNKSLRTTLRPWQTQKWLRKMVKNKCECVVIEASSHAIDQNRLWGIGMDTAVITNISENEHLDYHGEFSNYLKTKLKLFQSLQTEYRKPNVPKIAIINKDSKYADMFMDISCDRHWTYGIKNPADFYAKNKNLTNKNIEFDIRVPNDEAHISVAIIGEHNLENVLAGLTVAMTQKIPLPKIKEVLEKFPGVPTRLESINENQNFSVLVDYTYKPSALKAVLKTLKAVSSSRLVVVWGGAGGRAESNWEECGEILNEYADEIVLTTDDPYEVDPKYIAACVRKKIPRKEGENFFEIEDRYEAIRYAILTALPNDTILIAGRGHEPIQTIGKKHIEFDDREVCREILKSVSK